MLGGNGNDAAELTKLLRNGPRRQTIGGYFDSRLEQPHKPTGLEANFRVQVNGLNNKIPNNLYLIAGDPALEVQAEAINQIANQSLPSNTWRNVHSWLADLCHVLEQHTPKSTIFIDCNPSFVAYTELSSQAHS